MSSSLDEKAILSAVLKNPQEDAALQAYADWLGDRADSRSAYLREQVEFRKARSQESRRRLIGLYPQHHLAWTAMLEQAGAVEANLTNCECGWWGTEIGAAREAAGTYERFQYQDLPPLPVEFFDGTFAWLRASDPEMPYAEGPKWQSFCREKRNQGYFVPIEFERFVSERSLPSRIKSCTGNYFQPPPNPAAEIATPFAESADGLLVSFYADSQYCVLWGILLPREPGRYAPILAGPPEALFPNIWGDEEEREAYDPGEPVFVASQFEEFMFRWWIENEIWFATVWDETRRPLTRIEQAYIDHLNSRYSDR